ncbi:hypothetical protein [Candidatus Xianfuyuplasma coldseepsis]|uniref:Uncharacterized protein n=1 Tax=Candidatus Xianfuyuplasma coldseepsis TaxID=2782163 RepID=A0A7L7KQC0_9MOLU|nr:hypothetical protein [Xianfuyuplasma coldseepsis]QMS84887.1 hypothetical protein G4Z02_03670 [Xianfuyuplasma coldseepsis]
MFKKKNKKQQQIERLLEDELVVTAADIAQAIDEESTPKQDQVQPEVDEELEAKPNHQVVENQEETIELDEQETAKSRDVEDEEELVEAITTEPISEESQDIIQEILEENQEDSEEVKMPKPETVEEEPDDSPVVQQGFVWTDVDACDLPQKKLSRKERKRLEQERLEREKEEKRNKRKKRRHKVVEEQPQKRPEDMIAPPVEDVVTEEEKVDLNTFFETSKLKKKKLKRRDRKKYSRKELRRRKKREKKGQGIEDVKDQNLYKFRRKKYKTVEDFITYLNDNYLEIDSVAQDVLADERFFGWIGKKSGVFNQSLQEFKEIKAKTEKKS